MEMMKKDAEEYLQIARKENWEIRKMMASTESIVHLAENNVLSLSIFYYSYRLSAHGYTLQIAYNFNLTNGEKILKNNLILFLVVIFILIFYSYSLHPPKD